MDIIDEVKKILWEEYRSGKTQQELADKYHLKQSHISNILNGKKKISLEMLQTMFPHMSINFNGGIIAPVVNNGHNSGTMNGVVTDSGSMVDKILQSDLSAEEKIKFIELVRK